jgi:thiol:disulfide interchange protein/DsbC/DsbD-like thiol-disulfide interchange protein
MVDFKMHRPRRFLPALVIITCAVFAARLAGQSKIGGPVAARLITETVSVQAGRPFTVALLLSMERDWHVYWKYPGDSGLPTAVEWLLPPGFTAGTLQWPVPERIESAGLVTYGYSGQVLLMAEITPPAQGLAAGRSLQLQARASWLACRVECTPGKALLSASLPVLAVTPAPDPRWARDFRETRLRLPGRLTAASVSAAADSRDVILEWKSGELPPAATVRFYPGAPGQVEVSPLPRLSRDGLVVRLRMEREKGAGLPGRLSGILVAADASGSRAFEVDVPVATVRGGETGFLFALLLAFVGGLILNLMPCVLPVISLKVISFVGSGDRSGKGSARHGLLFALGVLISFWIIAGILVLLRSGGRLLGWGFQFQDPAVVLVTAVLFFLIGLNLFGVFEIGASLTRIGGVLRGKGGGAGSFLSGIFATAVATPCTAPFMGAAVGYALTHSPEASFAVFSSLALGMAAPYLLLSLVPGLASRLPKPGPWMETFRQVMAFPMMAAAIWMVSVLAALTGASAVLFVLGAMFASGLGAWVWGRWGALSRRTAVRAVAGGVALVLAFGVTALAAGLLPASSARAAEAPRADSPAGLWEPWSEGRLAELRGRGIPVFLDFTAKWCLSCQVNEKIALDNPSVQKRFREGGIATLRADWTDSSEAIAHALAGFGRASVPLYVFYPGGGGDPVFLPELLTPGIVLAVIGPD